MKKKYESLTNGHKKKSGSQFIVLISFTDVNELVENIKIGKEKLQCHDRIKYVTTP